MDTTLTLAFSIYNNPGVYALLLGSGISQAAGIPTAWDIAQDLKKQIAAVSGEKPSATIGYDEMLKSLAKTSTERNAILQRYFEPSDEDREQGIRVPTAAHRSIAQLMKAGYVKLVLTTNFDRLLEIALGDIGVIPDVIRSDDMLEGTPPVRHSNAMIVQLHGDYRDIRTLNTPEELENYTNEKKKLLDTIFDEYGLIICGWSAQWDTALRKSLLRAKPRWYTTFWVEPNNLSDAAENLIRHRKAEVIQATANGFFNNLKGQVEALANLKRDQPLSIAVAVERVKKLIPYSNAQIELEDFIRAEADRAQKTFNAFDVTHHPPLNTSQEHVQFYEDRFSAAVGATETILNMICTVCWYGDGAQSELITEILNKWGQPKDINEEVNTWRKMPALALQYVCGVAALRREKWQYLKAAIIDPKTFLHHRQKTIPQIEHINKITAFDYAHYNKMFSEYEPVSQLLKRHLQPIVKRYISQDTDFNNWFDLYEHILAIVMLKQRDLWLPHNGVLGEYAANGLWAFIKEFYAKGGRNRDTWGFLTIVLDEDAAMLESVLRKYGENAPKRTAWGHTIPDYVVPFTTGQLSAE